MVGSRVRQALARLERHARVLAKSEGMVLVRLALRRLERHLPLVVAGAFIVVALAVAASVSTATAQNLVVSPAAYEVPAAATVQPSPQVVYPQPPVWGWSGRPGMGEVAATGTLEIKNGQLVLSSASGDIVLTAPDGRALGEVTAVGPWTVSGGRLKITVRELLPSQTYRPLAATQGNPSS